MKQKSGPDKAPAEQVLKNIRRQTRRKYSAEEKIRIVLEGLRGEENISELCRREGIAASMYYGWSKEFLEAGKRRLAGDTARAATSDEVKDLRREATALKEVVAQLRDFCFAPSNGHRQPGHACPKGANNGSGQPYSITSSACARSVGEIVTPSTAAVLRLITSVYLVGACTGSSSGLLPLRMRSAAAVRPPAAATSFRDRGAVFSLAIAAHHRARCTTLFADLMLAIELQDKHSSGVAIFRRVHRRRRCGHSAVDACCFSEILLGQQEAPPCL